MSKSLLSKSTFCKADEKAHKIFYKYISELVHGSFLCSGNYRNETQDKYIVDTPPSVESVFFITYVLLLVLQSIKLELSRMIKNKLIKIEDDEIGKCESVEVELKDILKETIKLLEAENENMSILSVNIGERVDFNIK